MQYTKNREVLKFLIFLLIFTHIQVQCQRCHYLYWLFLESELAAPLPRSPEFSLDLLKPHISLHVCLSRVLMLFNFPLS